MEPINVNNNLTPREVAVLKLVSMGKADKEIAHLLNLCERTVRYDLQRIRTKLSVNTRVEAVAKAFQIGLFA